MKDSFIFEGKKYISSKRASAISDYASDYIGQLCRASKLDCRMIGRTWFVTEESLYLHKASISREEASRNRIENLKGPQIKNVVPVTTTSAPSIVTVSTNFSKITNDIVDTKNLPITVAVSTQKALPIKSPFSSTIAAPIIKSPYIYSFDNRPLLPELKKVSFEKKQNIQKNISVTNKIIQTTSIPRASTNLSNASYKKFVKNVPTYAELVRSIILKRVIAPAFVIVLFFGISTGLYLSAGKIATNIPDQFINSSQVVSANILSAFNFAFDSIKDGYRNVVAFFTSPAKLAIDSIREFGDVTVSEVTPNGIVISSSTGSELGDDVLKDKIASSFSDEVTVNPDKSGTAGVITPVFKDTKGKDFIYVMVPVKDKGASVIP